MVVVYNTTVGLRERSIDNRTGLLFRQQRGKNVGKVRQKASPSPIVKVKKETLYDTRTAERRPASQAYTQAAPAGIYGPDGRERHGIDQYWRDYRPRHGQPSYLLRPFS